MMCVSAKGDASIIDRGDLSNGGNGAAGGVDFSNCSMRGASFGNARLDNANFDGALLMGARFRGAKLTSASFRGAVLMGVNVSELGVPPEALKDCVLDVSAQAQAKSAELKAKLDAQPASGSHRVANREARRFLMAKTCVPCARNLPD